MYGLAVIEVMTLSGLLSNIDEIVFLLRVFAVILLIKSN